MDRLEKRFAQCAYCNLLWNVSKLVMPPKFYICPHCTHDLRCGT